MTPFQPLTFSYSLCSAVCWDFLPFTNSACHFFIYCTSSSQLLIPFKCICVLLIQTCWPTDTNLSRRVEFILFVSAGGYEIGLWTQQPSDKDTWKLQPHEAEAVKPKQWQARGAHDFTVFLLIKRDVMPVQFIKTSVIRDDCLPLDNLTSTKQ